MIGFHPHTIFLFFYLNFFFIDHFLGKIKTKLVEKKNSSSLASFQSYSGKY